MIVGDANMSETATFLKVATTALWFAVVEDDATDRNFTFATPVPAMRQVSADLTLSRPLEMSDGTTMTALEIQWELYRMCNAYADTHGLEAVGEKVGEETLRLWAEVLEGLERDPMSLAHQLDWVAKYRLIEGYRERHDLGWGDPRLRALDLQYHDIRPDKSLARRVGLDTLVDDDDVRHAVTKPPPDTRAWFRGTCLQRFPDEIVSANWDSMVFDIGGTSLKRVPMMEPMRGTEAALGAIVDASVNASDLLARLGS